MLTVARLRADGSMQTRQSFKDDVFVNAGVKATSNL